MNFESCLQTLFSRTQPGVGLEKLARLLDKLGSPQKKIRAIHVAGTNGKGTVCTLLARTLQLAGYKTGLFISPHLITPTERIQINGCNIPQDTFSHALQTVLDIEEEPLNFFELLTVVAFIYFAKEGVDFAVLETGLGGRKDPTNLCFPLLSIITSIGLDHTQILGDTLEKIAAEKAGIIKSEIPVLCGEMDEISATVIRQEAQIKQAPLKWIKEGEPFIKKTEFFEQGKTQLLKGGNPWMLPILGEKQTQNACLVYQAAKQLGVDDCLIKTAFETVQISCRFEVLHKDSTTLILDGAHNPQAIESLIRCWKRSPWATTGTLLCGFMKDKDYLTMFSLLSSHFQKIILTVPSSPRAAGEKELHRFLSCPAVEFVPDVRMALSRACLSGENILCTGSFYLVGAVRQFVAGAEKF